MKSYLVKWLIAIVLAVFFLWVEFETDLLPKEVYPLLVPDTDCGPLIFLREVTQIHEKSPGANWFRHSGILYGASNAV